MMQFLIYLCIGFVCAVIAVVILNIVDNVADEQDAMGLGALTLFLWPAVVPAFFLWCSLLGAQNLGKYLARRFR